MGEFYFDPVAKELTYVDYSYMHDAGMRSHISELIEQPYPKRIIYNGPATIVFWNDGTKTVVKRAKKDKDNKYNAFCAALAIKLYGSNSAVCRYVNSGITEKE